MALAESLAFSSPYTRSTDLQDENPPVPFIPPVISKNNAPEALILLALALFEDFFPESPSCELSIGGEMGVIGLVGSNVGPFAPGDG
jgi:hypothetical protein